jgi:gas vesicle protein
MESRSIKGPIAGFLIGGAIGGVIALLYAPKPGRELRNDIGRKTNELITEGKKASGEIWTGAKTKANSMLDSANTLLNTGKDKIIESADKVKDAVKAGVEAFNEEKEELMTMNGSTKPDSSTEKSTGSTRRGQSKL